MSKEELLKKIVEGELFKSIDQSEELNTFIHERENETGLKVSKNPEYRKAQRERNRLEREFKSLYDDEETGKKKVIEFDDLVERQGAISDMTHYEAGFSEGIKFLIGMLTE